MTPYQALLEAFALMEADPSALCWLRMSCRHAADWLLIAIGYRRDLARLVTAGPYALQHPNGARLVIVFDSSPTTPEVTRVWSAMPIERLQSRESAAQRPQRPPPVVLSNRELL